MSVDRALLPATFGPWFGRFESLMPVQERAIPLIMGGRDVLICSPTASGKTEAYASPAAEIVLANGRESAAVLIVSPTRALANDLKRRLEGPMNLVHVTFGRFTGEHKEKVAGKLPSIVICTPEALDSLLARRPEALESTRLVVLDEIHVLDNTARGDQLRILLRRLERIARVRPQRIAASATVDRPEALAARYLEDPELVVVPGARKLRVKAFDGASPAQVADHLEFLGKHGYRKILAFCRARNQVETYSAKLLGNTCFRDAVYAHHGSLAKNVRERNERLFLQAPAAVCFATLTLEMGIDIGTVDYVLLVGLPADVSSLLQRIGRGGRRGEETRCGYVVRSPAEDFVFRTMFRLARDGRLCSGGYGFRPAVIVQQALVLACSRAYIVAEDLERELPCDVLRDLGEGGCRAFLDTLVESGYMERVGRDRFVASESIEERYERGTLHSNIQDTPGVEVIDRLTGDLIARVEGVETRDIEVGGRNRRVVKVSDRRALTDSVGGAEPAKFRSAASPSVSLDLGRAVVEGLGVEAGRVGMLTAAGTTFLLHGLGTVGGAFLVELLAPQLGARGVAACGPYSLKLTRSIESLPRPEEESAARYVEEKVLELSKLCGPGQWSSSVSVPLRVRSVRQITEIDRVARYLAAAELQELDPAIADLAVIVDL